MNKEIKIKHWKSRIIFGSIILFFFFTLSLIFGIISTKQRLIDNLLSISAIYFCINLLWLISLSGIYDINLKPNSSNDTLLDRKIKNKKTRSEKSIYPILISLTISAIYLLIVIIIAYI